MRLSKVFVATLAILGILTSAASRAQPLSSTQLTYQIKLDSSRFGNAALGEIQTTLTREADSYRVESTTIAQGMAAILVGNFQESCEFRLQDGRALSQSYRGGRPEQDEYAVEFDWSAKKIHFKGSEPLDMPQGYVIDNCNMPFAMAVLNERDTADTVYVVDGKKTRIRGYRIRAKSREIVATKIGKLDTLKMVLEREYEPQKTVTLWLSRAHQFLPIKMEERRKSRTTTMMLTSLQVDT